MDKDCAWEFVNFINETLSEEEKNKFLFYIFRGYSLDEMMVKKNKIIIDIRELDLEKRKQYLIDGVY